jgi:hypothetical protein
MTQNLTLLCIASVCAFGLVSCDLLGGGSGGTEVKHPTVDQMAELEKQWGVQPRDVRSRYATPAGGGEAPLAPPQSGAPQIVTPDPVPLPQTATPPLVEPPPRAATPAQIQKLKN